MWKATQSGNMDKVYFLIGFLFCSASSLKCRDDGGRPVDWFVLYKLPKANGNSSAPNDGLSYLSLTSLSNLNWSLSSFSINSSDSAPAKTLKPLYERNSSREAFFAMYNDELPNGTTSSTKGHTKGVVAFEKKGGFWIIHSVPKYPPSPEFEYSYPHTGVVYGQSFLCISLPVSQANFVGSQLYYNHPYFYATNTPDFIRNLAPTLVRALSGEKPNRPPFFSRIDLFSSAGLRLTSYAKSAEFGKDLYADWVAESLSTSLAVETWINGADRMTSRCNSSYQVENVEQIRLEEYTNFTTHRDHSKWAVSMNSTEPWVCIGDINRMVSQTKRGGGCMCFKHKSVWYSFNQAINSADTCPLPQLPKIWWKFKNVRSILTFGTATSSSQD